MGTSAFTAEATCGISPTTVPDPGAPKDRPQNKPSSADPPFSQIPRGAHPEFLINGFFPTIDGMSTFRH